VLSPEALAAMHIVNVKGRDHMRATEGGNGTIIVISVSKHARIVHRESGAHYAYDPPVIRVIHT